MSELAPAARPGVITLEGYAWHMMTLEDFVDGRSRSVGFVAGGASLVETGPSPVLLVPCRSSSLTRRDWTCAWENLL